MAKIHSYTKAAGMSLLIHIVMLSLAAFVAGQVPASSQEPPPIEIEIEPSRLLDMGSGKLHFTSGSPPPGPKSAAKPRIRIAVAKPAVSKPAPSQPDLPSAYSVSPPLPGESSETSVTLPLPGDKGAAGGGSGYATGGTSGGGGTGIGGTGTGSGEGGGGGYSGAGYLGGDLPVYPSSARKSGREGIVTVRVLIGIDGNPVSVMVRVTSGHEDFDDVAVRAVKKWRFSPAKRAGQPVASFHDVRVKFRLDEAR